jgi:hypothetical protein
MLTILRIANLSLLVLFPIAWFAPLMRAGLLPIFGLSEISVISGMQALWESDVALALLVTAFALFAPYLKTIGIALVHFNLLKDKTIPVLSWIGRLAMADVSLPDRALYRGDQRRGFRSGRNRLGVIYVHSLHFGLYRDFCADTQSQGACPIGPIGPKGEHG